MITISKKTVSILCTALLLTACKDSSNNSTDDHQTDNFDLNETGRLVVTSSESAELGVFNSQDGSLIDRFTLNNSASGLYTSPQSRFALVVQRDNNQVQILDGGLYQEDHGDHLHPYEIAPQIMTQTLNGVRPTHYRDHEIRSAFFFDGNGEGSLLSSIISFDDEEILTNTTQSLALNNFMHGTAEPRGEHLITTYRAPEATSVLPDQVELHTFNNASGNYDFVERFEERCPALHGSFSTEDASIFGCSDGVLVIRQNEETFTAEKILNPAGFPDDVRIGGFSGFADSNLLAGWASGELYAIDLDNNSMTSLDWRGGSEADYSTAKMDDEGNILMVLDKKGGLHLLDATNNFSHIAEVKVLNILPELEDHTSVSIVSSKSSENVYISDAANNQLVVLNIESQQLQNTISLPFTPKHIAWVGVVGEEHEHH